ncbi:hypothetical protein A3A67_04510 [Candidatus Peribacteria bacterium RIFCSPLOWO2_01_FULL_51_18]|nr:MAG: hypothetical protein A3C52_04280 [Candidatus Peribacteria bacterium RIFCSPHIGHO2_02_FULL_51_15]OGJ65639.1 MAG: hypothetical protein A3A67_04510 [Candidatus Peribacteria bacterium RIFCSPLOWO2_01_FULL_51_18]OGJ68269.1 MAG: hypothetical protein A3J34_02435 [Candidatus Peribacteria bacterium RIFCSPLOWO2_02_FULL_51_10]
MPNPTKSLSALFISASILLLPIAQAYSPLQEDAEKSFSKALITLRSGKEETESTQQYWPSLGKYFRSLSYPVTWAIWQKCEGKICPATKTTSGHLEAITSKQLNNLLVSLLAYKPVSYPDGIVKLPFPWFSVYSQPWTDKTKNPGGSSYAKSDEGGNIWSEARGISPIISLNKKLEVTYVVPLKDILTVDAWKGTYIALSAQPALREVSKGIVVPPLATLQDVDAAFTAALSAKNGGGGYMIPSVRDLEMKDGELFHHPARIYTFHFDWLSDSFTVETTYVLNNGILYSAELVAPDSGFSSVKAAYSGVVSSLELKEVSGVEAVTSSSSSSTSGSLLKKVKAGIRNRKTGITPQKQPQKKTTPPKTCLTRRCK